MEERKRRNLLANTASKTLLAIRCTCPSEPHRVIPTMKVCVYEHVPLRYVLTDWALRVMKAEDGLLPPAARITGAGLKALDVDLALRDVRKHLPVRDGRLTVTVDWPAMSPSPNGAAVEKKDAEKEKVVKAIAEDRDKERATRAAEKAEKEKALRKAAKKKEKEKAKLARKKEKELKKKEKAKNKALAAKNEADVAKAEAKAETKAAKDKAAGEAKAAKEAARAAKKQKVSKENNENKAAASSSSDSSSESESESDPLNVGRLLEDGDNE